MQLELWGIDYFDLFLIHFPIALQYVDPAHRYPPEWFGDDGKVYLRKPSLLINGSKVLNHGVEKTPLQETWTAVEQLVDDGLAKNIGLRWMRSALEIMCLLIFICSATAMVHLSWTFFAMLALNRRFSKLSFTHT